MKIEKDHAHIAVEVSKMQELLSSKMGASNMRYAILSTGRNGGNLLCDVLSQTGVAGMVGKDGGHRGNEVYVGQGALLAKVDVVGRINQFFANNATPNGVEGAKINYPYLMALQKWVSWQTINEIMLSLDKAIVLVRRDKVAQAVSRLIAGQEMVWASWQKDKGHEAQYNRELIATMIARHTSGDAFFQEYVHQHCIPHMTVEYEEMVKDIPGAARAVVRFLNIDDSGVDWEAVEPRLQKQDDPRKDAWRFLYMQETLQKRLEK